MFFFLGKATGKGLVTDEDNIDEQIVSSNNEAQIQIVGGAQVFEVEDGVQKITKSKIDVEKEKSISNESKRTKNEVFKDKKGKYSAKKYIVSIDNNKFLNLRSSSSLTLNSQNGKVHLVLIPVQVLSKVIYFKEFILLNKKMCESYVSHHSFYKTNFQNHSRLFAFEVRPPPSMIVH